MFQGPPSVDPQLFQPSKSSVFDGFGAVGFPPKGNHPPWATFFAVVDFYCFPSTHAAISAFFNSVPREGVLHPRLVAVPGMRGNGCDRPRETVMETHLLQYIPKNRPSQPTVPQIIV